MNSSSDEKEDQYANHSDSDSDPEYTPDMDGTYGRYNFKNKFFKTPQKRKSFEYLVPQKKLSTSTTKGQDQAKSTVSVAGTSATSTTSPHSLSCISTASVNCASGSSKSSIEQNELSVNINHDMTNKFKNSSILDGKFFKLHTIHDRNIEAICQICLPKTKIIKGFANTTTNYLKHLKRVHPTDFEKYGTYKYTKINAEDNSKKEDGSYNKNKQQKIANFAKFGTLSVTQAEFDKRIVNFLASSMSPISIVENESFVKLFEGMNVKVMNRKAAVNIISEIYDKQVQKIIAKLKTLAYVCMTADIWSAKRRSFMGVTVHWIEADFSRGSAALACKRFVGTHDYKNIAEHLENIKLKFNINETKVIATVTDNASNFVKAFKQFCVAEEDEKENQSAGKNEKDNEDSEPEIDVEFETCNLEKYFQHILPNHVRCASPTINLIATTDCQRAIKNNVALRTRHMHAVYKCSQLWKMAGKSKSAETVQDILGHTLSYPRQTRWNSYHDSIGQILKEKNKLPLLFQRLQLDYFKETEIHYLEEYHKVMIPLAATLDYLQGPENTFYGYLLPSLVSLKNKLEKLKSHKFKYGGELLLNTAIESLEERFSSIFTLESKNAAIASVLCPNFKLRWFNSIKHLSEITIENIKKYIIAAGVKETVNEVSDNEPTLNDNDTECFFDFNEDDNETISPNSTNPSEDSEVYRKIELELIKYLDDKRKHLTMLNDYPILKKMFTKYNTCLPSSAPVERIFSFASIINSPQLNVLSDEYFEKLVLMKANTSISV